MSAVTADPRRPATLNRDLLPQLLQRGVYVLLIVLLVTGFASSNSFRSTDNLVNVLRSVSLVGITALGVAFVTFCGSLVDLSVAATVSVAGVVALFAAGTNPLLGIVAPLACGLVIGALNGLFVGKLRANPILLTLATTTIVGGLLLVATQSKVTYGAGTWLETAARARVLSIPLVVIVFLVLAAASQLALRGTTWGRRLMAVGGNERTALFAGLDVGKIRVQAFILSSLFASITGLLLAGNLGSATATAGTGYEFDALTAVVIGGARLTGGRGSAIGVLAGAVLVGVLSNLLVLWGAPYALQQVVKGVLLVTTVAISHFFGGRHD